MAHAQLAAAQQQQAASQAKQCADGGQTIATHCLAEHGAGTGEQQRQDVGCKRRLPQTAIGDCQLDAISHARADAVGKPVAAHAGAADQAFGTGLGLAAVTATGGTRRKFNPGFSARDFDDDGVYASTVLPGFRLNVPWLWQPERVSTERALAKMLAGAPGLSAELRDLYRRMLELLPDDEI